MNKSILAGALVLSLIPATNGFAQKIKIPKQVNPAKLERMVTQGTERFVPRISGVYIPVGTTVRALENRVASVAQKANIKLNKKDIRIIACNPERLLQFQKEAGVPIFEKHLLSYREGLKVLKANQENFAIARANSEYEVAWGELMDKKRESEIEYDDVSYTEESYKNFDDIAADVYEFYKFNQMDFENFPRVQTVGIENQKGVVLEIPVDGLSLKTHPFATHVNISAEKFVVIHYDNGVNQTTTRELLEKAENGQAINFRVIQ